MNQSSASVLSTAAAALYGTSEAWMVLITASPPLLALLLDSDGTSTTNMDAAFISFTLACCNFLWRSLQTPIQMNLRPPSGGILVTPPTCGRSLLTLITRKKEP